MRKLLSVLAVVWTLLLAGILVELRRIDASLAALGLPARALLALPADVPALERTETREQRRDRYKRESDAVYNDLVDRLHGAGVLNAADFPPKSRPSPKPTPDTRPTR